jgi:hypothetical protein
MATCVNEKDFSGFEALLSEWKGAYVCAVHSYVAIKTAEGPRLLCGRVYLLRSRFGIDETLFRCETDHVVAARFVSPPPSYDHDALIEQAKAGKMDGHDGAIVLGTENNNPLRAYFAPIHRDLHRDLLIPLASREPSLTVIGQPKSSLLQAVGDAQQITWELKAAKEPFDSLQELLAVCGLPALDQPSSATTLEIIAGTPAMISEKSVINDEEALIECQVAETLDVRKLRIGYRVLSKSMRVRRGSASGGIIEWRKENDFKVGTHRVQMGGDALIQVFLSYNGISLHQWWIADQKRLLNPRHAIHKVSDQSMELLRGMLFKPEGDKARVFENAISTLLFLLGFSVANYGRIPKLQDGPDVVMVTPFGHVAVVECTIGLLDKNDKLAKLVQRTKLIREALAEAGHNHLEVQPAIVTPLSREEVAAGLATAGDHGIAVICKEDIERALVQVSYWPNPDQVFQDTKRLIPARPSQDLDQ